MFPGKVHSWNYQNQQRKPAIRQSEKELLLEQKQQQSQERRAKRERQLHYLVELNKHITPSDKRLPRDRSPGHHLETEGEEKGHEPEHPRGRELRRRSSPVSNTEVTHRPGSPASRTAKSQPSRSRSPPVPAVRHKVGKNPAENFEADYNTSARSDKHHHIAEPDLDDKGNILVPTRETDFIPIMRTADVLDPFRAEEPIPPSRENSHITRARQRYHKNLHPADYGGHLDVHSERQRHPVPAGKVSPGRLSMQGNKASFQVLIHVSVCIRAFVCMSDYSYREGSGLFVFETSVNYCYLMCVFVFL